MLMYIFLFVIGLAFGSFLNATVWRLHAKRNFVSERSECEKCHHTLEPLDLIPVFSWLFLRGKCRYCHKPISIQHPLTELATGVLFSLSWLLWPGGHTGGAFFVVQFIFWLLFLVGALILGIYDFRWQILPDVVILPLVLLAIVDRLIGYIFFGTGFSSLLSASLGVIAICGFFGLLYTVSKREWIGLGDVKLGAFIGLVLGLGQGVVALVLSYYIGALAVIPLLVSRKLKAKSAVAFGPFLLLSFTITFFFGHHLVSWYNELIQR